MSVHTLFTPCSHRVHTLFTPCSLLVQEKVILIQEQLSKNRIIVDNDQKGQIHSVRISRSPPHSGACTCTWARVPSPPLPPPPPLLPILLPRWCCPSSPAARHPPADAAAAAASPASLPTAGIQPHASHPRTLPSLPSSFRACSHLVQAVTSSTHSSQWCTPSLQWFAPSSGRHVVDARAQVEDAHRLQARQGRLCSTRVAVLAGPRPATTHAATTGSSGCIGRPGVALRTREERPSASDPAARP